MFKKHAHAQLRLFVVSQPNTIEQFPKEFWWERLDDRWRFERGSGQNIPCFELPAYALECLFRLIRVKWLPGRGNIARQLNLPIL